MVQVWPQCLKMTDIFRELYKALRLVHVASGLIWQCYTIVCYAWCKRGMTDDLCLKIQIAPICFFFDMKAGYHARNIIVPCLFRELRV